jgi:hypothetical protein
MKPQGFRKIFPAGVRHRARRPVSRRVQRGIVGVAQRGDGHNDRDIERFGEP